MLVDEIKVERFEEVKECQKLSWDKIWCDRNELRREVQYNSYHAQLIIYHVILCAA